MGSATGLWHKTLRAYNIPYRYLWDLPVHLLVRGKQKPLRNRCEGAGVLAEVRVARKPERVVWLYN